MSDQEVLIARSLSIIESVERLQLFSQYQYKIQQLVKDSKKLSTPIQKPLSCLALNEGAMISTIS